MIKQISFAKLEKGMAMPHLLDIQVRAFESLLQLDAAAHDREDVGLERVFKDLFPITDVHENPPTPFESKLTCLSVRRFWNCVADWSVG